MQGTVANIFKILFFFVILMVIISAISYGLFFNQAIGYKQYIGDQISREGGLTTSAMANLDEYSANNYSSRFKVVSESGNAKQPYGAEVKYHIEGTMNESFFNLPAELVKLSGVGVSKVR